MIYPRVFTFLLISLFLGALGTAHADDPTPSCAFENAACGYVDSAGTVVIPPRFDVVAPFNAGLAVVMTDGQFGIVNAQGDVIAPLEYEGAATFTDGSALVYKDGTSRLIDGTGTALAEARAEVIFRLDQDHVLIGTELGSFDPARLDLLQVIQGRGKWWVRSLSSGEETTPVLAEVSFPNNPPWSIFWLQIDGKYFLTAANGQRLTDGLDYGGNLAEGLIVAEKDRKWGFIDTQGQTVIDFQFDFVSGFHNDRWSAFRVGPQDNAKYGYIDQTGKIVIPAQFDEVLSFEGDLAKVTLNGASITIDRTGRRSEACRDAFLAVGGFPEGFHLQRADGTPVNAVVYSYAKVSCGQPTLVVLDDDTIGYLDNQGALLAGRYFYQAHAFYDGVAVVWTDSEHVGIIDTNGDFIVAPVQAQARIISSIEHSVINPGPDHVIVTAEVARALAQDSSLLTNAPEEGRRYTCQAARVDIVTTDGVTRYVDAAGQTFIEGGFDHATCFFLPNGKALVAIRDRRMWCEISKRGEIDDASCQCSQPIIIFELWSQPPSDDRLDCYDAGLKLVKEYQPTP
jgi:hypothetical protein